MKNHFLPPCPLLVCASFVLLLVAPAVAAAADFSYELQEKIFLSCGAKAPSADNDRRNWTGDAAGSKSAPSVMGTEVYAPQSSSVPQVPYLTARMFTSPSTYSITLSPGRIFLRLYFYPSSAYSSNFNSTDAFFNVTAGGYTLLQNFSASLVADNINFAFFSLEYSLNVSTSPLNLTFTPVKSHDNKSFAFINGIEIVPIPDLFSSQDAMLIGSGGPIADEIDPDQALQTMYRLNVGGQGISPGQDAGSLFRSWADDSQYIYGAAYGVTFSNDPNVTINYTASTVPNYTAPMEVYSTARSMGPNPQINLNYNLSWYLQVDAGFQYLVRLHFCEIQSEITLPNQRVFDIYLSNQTAQDQADVIAWSNGLGIPVYKDYVVLTMGTGKMDLWVELHPNIESKPQYYDAILNGLEVFKLAKIGSSTLAGLNPEPTRINPEPTNAPTENNGGTKVGAIVGGVVGGGAALVILAALFLILRSKQQKKKKKQQQQLQQKEKDGKDATTSDEPSTLWPLSLYGNSHSGASPKTQTGSYGSSLPANLCRYFTIAEIRAATKDFDESLVIGVGGFGKVYCGVINGGSTKVAIKRGNPMAEQGVHEFQTEIEMLSKLRHRHLVSLIGYCEDNFEMILVYDYMARGTLREHLYRMQKPPLPWKQRLEICIGAARGLHYLHTGAKHTIIHRDVKTTNILLDDKWVAKVSDFGLSKVGPAVDDTHVSTVVKGSFGYLDPEYFRRQQLTDKSDVYSFGVVLFEVLCARPALDTSLPKEQSSLAEWALHCQKKGVLEDIMDPYLKDRISPQCFKKFAETAEKCVSEVGIERPSMGDVLWNLEFTLQLQESAEESGNIIGGISEDEVALLMARKKETETPLGTSSGVTSTTVTTVSMGGRSITSEDSDRMTPSAVFSQIMNPNGR